MAKYYVFTNFVDYHRSGEELPQESFSKHLDTYLIRNTGSEALYSQPRNKGVLRGSHLGLR